VKQPAGVPPGFSLSSEAGLFADEAGPFHFADDGAAACGLLAEPHHTNTYSLVHGGCLMTLGAVLLERAARQALGGSSGRAIRFATSFLAPLHVGDWVGGAAKAYRTEFGTAFARGRARVGSRTIIAVDGIFGAQRFPTATHRPTGGPPAGFQLLEPYAPFTTRLVDYLERWTEDGVGLSFQVAERHTGSAGTLHAGMAMTYADGLLGRTVRQRIGRGAVTQRLEIDLMGPAYPGEWLVGSASVEREEGAWVFVAGSATTTAGMPVLRTRGVFSQVGRDQRLARPPALGLAPGPVALSG
jgi:acyl-coenzyme A thioesterase PaaI-like protein